MREMFPHLPLAAIIDDLHETGAVEATVENILEGRLLLDGVSRKPVKFKGNANLLAIYMSKDRA